MAPACRRIPPEPPSLRATSWSTPARCRAAARGRDTTIQVEDADIAQTVDRQIQQIRSNFPSDQEFLRQLRQAGFGTQDEYRRWISEQARRSELQRRLVQKYQLEK